MVSGKDVEIAFSTRAALLTMLAAGAASSAATCWWMWLADVSPARAIGTPIPYLIALLAMGPGVLTFQAAREWFDYRLSRYVLAITIAVLPVLLMVSTYFLYPRNAFATALVLSTAWVGASVFWVIVKRWRL